MNQFTHFVSSELSELKSRDADTLFECIRDNLQEMGLEMTETMDDELYSEIESQLKGRAQ